MTDGEDAPQVVSSVGPLDATVVLVREFLHRSGALPHGVDLDAEPPALPEMRAWPPFQVDAAAAQIAAPPGAVADVAGWVRELAGRLGGRNVAMAQFETTDPQAP